MKNLPTDLLRTFVTIVREDGFSKAGKKLGRSQPAISLQMNRLEDLVDMPIMYRDGRSFKLTDEGRMLLDYAQRILRLNDEALLRLSRPEVTGKVRLGIPHEFAISYLADFLSGFAEAYPGVEMEVVSELSSRLLERQAHGELDLVVAIHKEVNAEPTGEGWYEKLVWVTDIKHFKSRYETVPLVVAPHGCVYRHRMLDTLDSVGVPWRIVYTGTSYGGICAAVTAGLGVTVLARNTVPQDLQTHASTNQLPALAGAVVELHYDRFGTEDAVQQLAQYIQKVSRQILTG